MTYVTCQNIYVYGVKYLFIFRYTVLQESLIKLVEACSDQSHSMDRWLSKLEASNWQTHIKEILTTACLAAQCIDRSGSILHLKALIETSWDA